MWVLGCVCPKHQFSILISGTVISRPVSLLQSDLLFLGGWVGERGKQHLCKLFPDLKHARSLKCQDQPWVNQRWVGSSRSVNCRSEMPHWPKAQAFVINTLLGWEIPFTCWWSSFGTCDRLFLLGWSGIWEISNCTQRYAKKSNRLEWFKQFVAVHSRTQQPVSGRCATSTRGNGVTTFLGHEVSPSFTKRSNGMTCVRTGPKKESQVMHHGCAGGSNFDHTFFFRNSIPSSHLWIVAHKTTSSHFHRKWIL